MLFLQDPVLKMAEDNYSLLLNYLQKQTFPSTTPQSQKDTVTSIAKNFVIQKGVLYYKKGKTGDLRCLEVGTKDRKVAMQAAHVSNGMGKKNRNFLICKDDSIYVCYTFIG